MDDVTEPVHVGVLDGVLLEEVVLHELDAALMQSRRVLARPDLGLALFEDRRAILDDEFEVRVDVRELETEAT